jgi:hypothetical protein
MVAGFLVHQGSTPSSITGEAMQEASGRLTGDTSTDHRMANPWRMLRNRHHAMCITPTPMMFPGIGHIDFRRRLHLPTDPMCRAAPPRA